MEGASNVTISGGAQIISAAGPLRRTAKKKIVTGTWPKGEEAPDEIKVETFKNARGVKIIDSTVENFVVSGLKAKPGQKLLVRLGEGAATDLTYHGEACYVVNSHDYTIDIEDGDSGTSYSTLYTFFTTLTWNARTRDLRKESRQLSAEFSSRFHCPSLYAVVFFLNSNV